MATLSVVVVTRSPWLTVCTTVDRWLRTDDALWMVRSRSWLSALALVLRDELWNAVDSALPLPPPTPSRPPTGGMIAPIPNPPANDELDEVERPRLRSVSVALTISLTSRSRSTSASIDSVTSRASVRALLSRRSQSTIASCFSLAGSLPW